MSFCHISAPVTSDEHSFEGQPDPEQEIIRSIQLSPIASVVTDPKAHDNPIVAVNRAFEQLTGYAEQEIVGQNCRILSGAGTDKSRAARLRHAVSTATPAVVELLNYRKDGSTFWNAVMVAPVLDDSGQLAYFVGSQMQVDRSHAGQAREDAATRVRALTAKQQTVLRLMARGMRNRQIGEELGLTEKTIKMHRVALVRRLGLSTSAEAMRIAIEAGF
jgi:PAS domain S-box-containing protein